MNQVNLIDIYTILEHTKKIIKSQDLIFWLEKRKEELKKNTRMT